jgi:tRNA nucleotidyltransferase (CCA-adding enzyme)
MATSRNHGAPSSDLDLGLKKLTEISELPEIKKLLAALGPESQLHLVGGAVRDALLNHENKDIDLTTKFHPSKISELLEKANIRWEPTGIEHGTILAVFDNTQIEVTTFRKPGRARIDRGPEIFSESIDQDLAGRDFTINALAFDLNTKHVVDPFGGIADLEHKIIRAVGSADARFKEDPLRILRMARFGPAANRQIDPATLAAAEGNKESLLSISQERIRDEFIKIICGESAASAVRQLRLIGVLDLILPEIVPSYDFEQNDFHRFDVFEHTLAVLDNCPRDPLLRLTAIFHDLGKPSTLSVGADGRRHFYKHEIESTTMTKTALKRMRCSNNTIKNVSQLVRYHMRPLKCGPTAVRRLIRDLGPLMEPWLQFKLADCLGAKVSSSEILSEIKNFRDLLNQESQRSNFLQLAITGDDIKALGITEGPVVGGILNSLRELVLADPAINNRESLIQLAKDKFISPK